MSIFSLIGSIIGGNSAKKSADKAAQLQYDATVKGINEEARQYDTTRADYTPYQALGVGAAPHLGNLVGTNGDGALQAELDRIMGGPRYNSIMQNGRDEMLATASATGGLRGGNYQDASQRFGGDVLSSEIDRQLAEYSGLVGIGSGAAGAVGQFGANSVARSNLLRNQGADARASAEQFRGFVNAQNWKNAGGFLDQAVGAATGGGGFNWKSLF